MRRHPADLAGCFLSGLRYGGRDARFGQPSPRDGHPIGALIVHDQTTDALVPRLRSHSYPALGSHDRGLRNALGPRQLPLALPSSGGAMVGVARDVRGDAEAVFDGLGAVAATDDVAVARLQSGRPASHGRHQGCGIVALNAGRGVGHGQRPLRSVGYKVVLTRRGLLAWLEDGVAAPNGGADGLHVDRRSNESRRATDALGSMLAQRAVHDLAVAALRSVAERLQVVRLGGEHTLGQQAPSAVRVEDMEVDLQKQPSMPGWRSFTARLAFKQIRHHGLIRVGELRFHAAGAIGTHVVIGVNHMSWRTALYGSACRRFAYRAHPIDTRFAQGVAHDSRADARAAAAGQFARQCPQRRAQELLSIVHERSSVIRRQQWCATAGPPAMFLGTLQSTPHMRDDSAPTNRRSMNLGYTDRESPKK